MIVLVAFAAVGALAGVVWEWLWDAPVGVAFDHKWLPDLAAARAEFSGTGWYVVVGVRGRAAAAAVRGLAFDRLELLTLAVVLAGSALAAWLMLQVGTGSGPARPQAVGRDGRRRHQDPGATSRSPGRARSSRSRPAPWSP